MSLILPLLEAAAQKYSFVQPDTTVFANRRALHLTSCLAEHSKGLEVR